MPIELQQLPLVFLLAFSFAFILGAISILVSLIGNLIRKNKGVKEPIPQQIERISVKTSGEQLNRSFQYAIYLIIIEIIMIAIIFPIYSFSEKTTLIDIWPILLFVADPSI